MVEGKTGINLGKADVDPRRGVLNGYIIIGLCRRVNIEELTLNLSRDLTRRYDTGVVTPSAIIPGQERIEWSIKRAFASDVLFQLYKKRCLFPITIMNNTRNPGSSDGAQTLFVLKDCIMGNDNFGPLNGQDFMTEDVSGEALDVILDAAEIAEILNPSCGTIPCVSNTADIAGAITSGAQNIINNFNNSLQGSLRI